MAQKKVEGPVPNPMQIGHGEGFSSVTSEHPIFEAFGIVERFVESEDRTLWLPGGADDTGIFYSVTKKYTEETLQKSTRRVLESP